MSHPDQGLLHALLDGEVAAAEAARIQAHLEQCPTCRQELEQARDFRAEALALVQALDTEPVVAAAPGSAPRAAPIPRRPGPQVPWGQALAWAASLVLAASAGYFAASSFPRPPIELPSSSGPATSLEGAAHDERRERQTEPESRTESPKPETGAVAIAARPATATPGPTPSAAPRSDGRPRDAAAEPAAPARADELAAAPPVVAKEQAVEEPARRVQAEPQVDALASQRARVAAPAAARLSEVAGTARSRLDRVADSAGFRLRLVAGLRIEDVVVVDSVIRTTYATPWGPLVVEQWQTAGRLQVRLVPSPGSPPDSVAAWTARASRDP